MEVATPLGQRQRRFLPLLAKLIDFAYSHGYELSAGECYRTPEQAALNAQHGTGIANSLHILRLAMDLQLFKDGMYLTDSAAYKPLGEFWKSLDPDCAWGGDWKTRTDGNHFSLRWGGVE
jgi:hypothetical protein